jgi:hypothetical protein
MRISLVLATLIGGLVLIPVTASDATTQPHLLRDAATDLYDSSKNYSEAAR